MFAVNLRWYLREGFIWPRLCFTPYPRFSMRWFRLGLEIIGAASVLLLLAVVFLVFYESSDKIDSASKKDALFILNWGGISTNQDFKIVASYRSSRTFTGDHLDYYCIELPKFEVADYVKGRWEEGPETNPIFAEALELGANDAHEHGDCFPSGDEANSPRMKIMFESVYTSGHHPTAAEIILYDAKKSRLYYVSYKD